MTKPRGTCKIWKVRNEYNRKRIFCFISLKKLLQLIIYYKKFQQLFNINKIAYKEFRIIRLEITPKSNLDINGEKFLQLQNDSNNFQVFFNNIPIEIKDKFVVCPKDEVKKIQ